MSSRYILEMPCLGRPFQLGMLYDCRSDRLIPGVTLWGAEKLNKAVSRKPQETSDFEVIAEDRFDEKTLQLDIDAGLKLSLLGGLVRASGAGNFLYDCRSSNNQARVSLKYKSTSRFEQLTMDHLGQFEYPTVFDEDIATHVVTEVLYGADAFFVFDREVGKDEDFHEVHGSMEALISALPGWHVGGGASPDIQCGGKSEVEKLKCKFHGDFILPENPTTFHDAVKLYQDLPELLGADSQKSVPKKVWLHPLGMLDSRAQRNVQEITLDLIDKIQMLMIHLHDFEMQSNDLIKGEVCSHFVSIKGKLQKAKKCTGLYKSRLEKRLATLLPQIRGGGAEEIKLAEILEENSLSPFGHQHLSSWLNGKEKEVNILTGYLQKLQQQHIQLAFAPGKMEPIIQDLEVEKVLCFDFNVTGREDVFLQKMETYLRRKQVIQEDCTQKSWYATPALMQELRLRLRLYLDFVEANHSRQDVKFVVTDGDSEAAAESSQVALITLYENACPTEFELPDQPGKPTASDVTHNSLKLNWTKPKHGAESIQAYTLFRRPLDGPTDKWVSQEISSTRDNIHVSELDPETVYVFKLAAETAAGTSPESHLSDPITTKPLPDNSLGLKILQHCEPISKESTPPIFQLPTRDVMRKESIAKVHVGHSHHHHSAVPVPHKVLMVVGATGAGKSTLINGIANYIMGVRWEDEFRFKLISEEGNRSQARSQTKCITAYTFHHMEGSPLPYTLTIIDTPGFGDTEGLERDKEITAQIKEFFSITGEEGIDQLNGIGFVTQASPARLNPTQQHIFDSIFSIFGKNTGSKIFLFADGQHPPVLDPVKAADIPIQNHFKFSSSAVYTDNSTTTDDELNKKFWKMGMESFASFFDQISKSEPQTLQLTRDVLQECEQLELAASFQVSAGLAEIDQLQKEKEGHTCPTEFDPPDRPGKPTASDVTHNSLKLNWTKPKHGAESIQAYTLFRRPLDGPTDKWVSQEISSTRDNIHVSELDPETVYVFKLAAETAAGTSPESELSDPITTKPSPDVSLALKMLQHCKPISKESTPPIFQLPTRDVMRKTDIAKVHIGHSVGHSYHHHLPPTVAVPHKVLMVVGATGAGKSTLINGIANYIMGVQWEDEFRFKLISDEGGRSQAHSQTRCITAYTFHRMEGSPLSYTLTIIDTPGFGDTQGLERDKEIIAQIKTFFSITGEQGIDQLHGIGFVTQAPLARLTPTQMYIFDSILAIFGKDIGSNIFLMTTFADGQRPPVLDAVKTANIPFQNHFKFNNSALFANSSASADDEVNKMFWKMGMKNFAAFFSNFSQAEPQSLQLTRGVLQEREQLEAAIDHLQPQIHAGLTKIDELRQEEQILRGHQAEVLANKDFTYSVTVTKQRQVNLPRGTHTTNCLQCNYTCHNDCKIAYDTNKYKCSVMDRSQGLNARCTVCPFKCSWRDHKNNPYKFELYQEKETRTLDELKARYKSAMTDKNQVEAVINQINIELEEMDKAVLLMIQQAKKSLQRLGEIALKPNPLTEVEYIDLLIESEKQQAKPGYLQRVKVYEHVREQANILSAQASGELQPKMEQASSIATKSKDGRTVWESVKSLWTEK